MTITECERLRRQIWQEYPDAPSTQLVEHPSGRGHVLKMRNKGRWVILAHRIDLERHLRWQG